jgi:hypothetical protein
MLCRETVKAPAAKEPGVNTSGAPINLNDLLAEFSG